MPVRRHHLLILLGLLLLATSLRLFHLGEWSFAHDEVPTFGEVDSLFRDTEPDPASQTYRLPRIIPLSYSLLHLGYELFGRDEFGSRVLVALMGALSVGLAYLLLLPMRGGATALAVALLITLWPEHLFQSQQNRFYISAMLLCSLSLLGGAWAVQRRSTWALALACLAGVVAVLAHTLSGLSALVLLGAGVGVAAFADRASLPRYAFVVAGITLLALLGEAIYLFPLLHGWNAGHSWGYSPAHGVMSGVIQLGWPVAVLAAVGVGLLAMERAAQNWYWVALTVGWTAFLAVAPLAVTYHPSYSFPIALGVLVSAGVAVGRVYELLREARGRTAAVLWLALACLMNLPSIVSHYVDGSRPDYRTAARFVADHAKSGDRVTARSAALFTHYAPEHAAQPLGSSTVASLQKQTLAGGRLWIVVQNWRGGLPEEERAWLDRHCTHELRVRRTRFDYPENSVDVYLWQGKPAIAREDD
jgi:Dolichyl-phosphate-mannose-protein mannosyltransferase